MTIKEKLQALATETGAPCVTISLNTHRTHPENAQDRIRLKNLLQEAEERVIKDFGKRPAESLLEKLAVVESEIDINYNLESLHIYLSNNTKEIIKSTWPTNEDAVRIADTFDTRSLIKAYNRSEDYAILLLSQGGVALYTATDDGITGEIKNDDFPFTENPHANTNADRTSDAKYLDDLVREFFNTVDKAVVKFFNDTHLPILIICTEDNYSRFIKMADKPSIYLGYAPINYNSTETHNLAKQGWEVVKTLQQERRTAAISEMKEAVGAGTVLTDLQEIFQAAKEGRGDLLMVHENFTQPVLMKTDTTFELAPNTSLPDVVEDITSTIAWEVLSKNGRVYFTQQDEIKELGKIVLKTRY